MSKILKLLVFPGIRVFFRPDAFYKQLIELQQR
jgi:hypothetical protein